MIDNTKMTRPEFGETPGEMALVCGTIQRAADVIRTADLTPDEQAKKPLLDGARKMLQNAIDVLDGRLADGGIPSPDTEEDD